MNEEALRAEIAWLCEFVQEPEWFPNGGDRQYWRERFYAAQRIVAPATAASAAPEASCRVCGSRAHDTGNPCGGASAEPGGAAPSGGATALDSREAMGAQPPVQPPWQHKSDERALPCEACGSYHLGRCAVMGEPEPPPTLRSCAEHAAMVMQQEAEIIYHQGGQGSSRALLDAAESLAAALSNDAPASARSAAPESSEGGGGGAPAAGEPEARNHNPACMKWAGGPCDCEAKR